MKISESLEDFIADWYWDKKSHQYAQKLGLFIFDFFAHLEKQNLSEKTIKKHKDNCWLIGNFQCGYGILEKEFSIQDIFYSSEANYEYEFQRKVSDSTCAINSYRSTWKKLFKFAQQIN